MDLAIVHGNMVKNAVVRKLRAIAGDVPIYAEQILQDFEEPCFFVYESSVYEERDIEPVFWQHRKIEVKYYTDPDSSQRCAEALAMGERIRRTLAYIELESNSQGYTLLTRAIGADFRLFEDYCVYYATYRLKCRIQEGKSALMAQRQDNFKLL